MLTKLNEILEKLPSLLDSAVWDSLIVNRRKPHTYRIWTKLGDLRVCLHKFDVCDTNESFFHPHPWPAAFKILQGKYYMRIGHSLTQTSEPFEVAPFIMFQGSSYAITDPLTWHSVSPIETTFTVMVNDKPFENPHKEVRRTAGKDLEKMTDEEVKESLEYFRKLLK